MDMNMKDYFWSGHVLQDFVFKNFSAQTYSGTLDVCNLINLLYTLLILPNGRPVTTQSLHQQSTSELDVL